MLLKSTSGRHLILKLDILMSIFYILIVNTFLKPDITFESYFDVTSDKQSLLLFMCDTVYYPVVLFVLGCIACVSAKNITHKAMVMTASNAHKAHKSPAAVVAFNHTSTQPADISISMTECRQQRNIQRCAPFFFSFVLIGHLIGHA